MIKIPASNPKLLDNIIIVPTVWQPLKNSTMLFGILVPGNQLFNGGLLRTLWLNKGAMKSKAVRDNHAHLGNQNISCDLGCKSNLFSCEVT
jgi:hypothetical protein